MQVDITPLKDCIDEVKKLAKLYSNRGAFSRMARNRFDKGRIQDLQRQIDDVVATIGLATSVQLSEQVEGLREAFSAQHTLLVSSHEQLQ